VPGERAPGPFAGPAFALQFLTRLPLPAMELGPGALGRAAGWFPAVGALVGLWVAGAARLAVACGLPPGAALVVGVAAGIALTGALHEDGLADTADGLGGRDRARSLAIMRDSRSGAFGVLALVLLLLGRLAALEAIPLGTWAPALVLAHAVGRWVALLHLRFLPYARTEALGVAAPMREGIGRTQLALGTLVVAGAAAWLGPAGAGALIGALVFALLGGAWLRRWLGGTTGDTLGAAVCGGELLTLLWVSGHAV
jgi:adenosylcobinamide-GDP ribazoletransferase